MEIIEVAKNKKHFLSLLLLADEHENMIDRYIENGIMYVLNDNGVKVECVIIDVGNSILCCIFYDYGQIHNIAVEF